MLTHADPVCSCTVLWGQLGQMTSSMLVVSKSCIDIDACKDKPGSFLLLFFGSTPANVCNLDSLPCCGLFFFITGIYYDTEMSRASLNVIRLPSQHSVNILMTSVVVDFQRQWHTGDFELKFEKQHKLFVIINAFLSSAISTCPHFLQLQHVTTAFIEDALSHIWSLDVHL